MKLPKKIAALLTVTLVASSAGNVGYADTLKSVSQDKLVGAGRWETAIEVSKKGWTKATEAIIVNDNAIADALAATPFAEANDAPILLTGKDKLDERTKAELKRLGVKKVYLIGGEAVLSTNIETDLKAQNIEIDRIHGATRELTAIEIAKRLDEIKDISEIAVVNGTTGLADAVSIAAVAADKDMAIILSNPNNGTKDSDEFIKSEDIKTSYIIGGEKAVSKEVESKLPNVKRIEGINRNETNAKVIETFYTERDINNAYVAKDGMGKEDQLIDALSVGVLAAKNDSPVIIVGNKLNQMQKDVTNTKSFKTVTQVGGNGNETAFNELKDMQGVTTYEVKTSSELNDALAKANANDVINVRSLNDNSRNQNTEIKSENAITINIDSTSEKTLSIDIKNGTVKIRENQTVIYMESGELVIEGKISTVNVVEGGNVTIINESTSKPNVTVAEGASVEVDGKFNNITVNGKDAVVSVEKDSTVSKIEVSKDASGTVIENAGKVDKVTSNAPNVSVDNSGTVGTVSGTGSNKPTIDNSGGGTIGSGSTGGGSGYIPPADTTAPILAKENEITIESNGNIVTASNGETLIIDNNQKLTKIQMSENIYLVSGETGRIQFRDMNSSETWSDYGTFTVKDNELNVIKENNSSLEGKYEYKIEANVLKDRTGNKNNEIKFNISTYTSLENAIKGIKEYGESSETIILCDNTQYEVKNTSALLTSNSTEVLTIKSKDSKNPVTLKFTGSGEGNSIRVAGEGKLVLKDITIIDESTYNGAAWEKGNLEMASKLEFNNVTFKSGVLLDSSEATFTDCKFTSDIGVGFYAAWVSEGIAEFRRCTFNSPRNIKIHEAYGSKVNKVTVDGNTFTGERKPAVVIGEVASDVEVSIKNNKVNENTKWDNVGSKEGIDGVYESDTYTKDFIFEQKNNLLPWDGIALCTVASVNGVYQVSTASQLAWIEHEVNQKRNTNIKNIELMCNIDLNNKKWTPIGQTGNFEFKGTFNGNGNIISNLFVDTTAEKGEHHSSGLFGWIDDGSTIKDLTIKNANVKGNQRVGAIVGYIESNHPSTVENCYVIDSTIAAMIDKAGAVVGLASNPGTTIKNCKATTSEVTANRDAGQIVGASKTNFVSGCSATDVTVKFNGIYYQDRDNTNIRNEIIGREL